MASCNLSALFTVLFVAIWAPEVAHGALDRALLSKLKAPSGFTVSVYTDRTPAARSLALSPSGILYVGTRQGGKVYAVGKDGAVRTVASGLTSPNGVAFREGSLFVAEINRILRYDKVESNLKTRAKPDAVILDDLPEDEHHGWKFIAFGPDGWLYAPVGAPCNVCDSQNPVYASIQRLKADGSGRETFARGVRNTVGFDWHPTTKEMWFTDNGRDMLGDDVPADELNRAPKAGLHFGFPFCHAGDVADPEFVSDRSGKKRSCAEFVPPSLKLGAHVAALGMRFYSGSSFPETYRGRVFIAEHGSWNRSTPTGYRLMTAKIASDGKASDYSVFIEGWLQGGSRWGRPVDLVVASDGSLLVSDDHAGAIYRIAYSPR